MTIKLTQKKVWTCGDYIKEYGVVYVVSRANYKTPSVYLIERKSVGHTEPLPLDANTLVQAKRIIEADVARIKETGEVHGEEA